VIEAIALPLAGVADRVRGGYPEGKRPKWARDAAKAVAGAVMAAQVVGLHPIIAAVAASVALLGWRFDNGWRGKWVLASADIWHYEKRSENKIVGFSELTLAREATGWGVKHSIAYAPLAMIDWRAYLVFVGACMVGTVFAMLLANTFKRMPLLEARTPWSVGELIELPVIGLLFHLIMVGI